MNAGILIWGYTYMCSSLDYGLVEAPWHTCATISIKDSTGVLTMDMGFLAVIRFSSDSSPSNHRIHVFPVQEILMVRIGTGIMPPNDPAKPVGDWW